MRRDKFRREKGKSAYLQNYIMENNTFKYNNTCLKII